MMTEMERIFWLGISVQQKIHTDARKKAMKTGDDEWLNRIRIAETETSKAADDFKRMMETFDSENE